MIRGLAVCLAAASLSACDVPGGVASPGSTPPVASAPAASPSNPSRTQEAVDIAYKALDTTATAVNVAIDFGVLKPGSPAALTIADGMEQANMALKAADAAQRINDAFAFNINADAARAAMARIQTALASIKRK